MLSRETHRKLATPVGAAVLTALAVLVVTGLLRLILEDNFRPAWFWVASSAVLVLVVEQYRASKRPTD